MIYGSVCSGIEAATVAWHPLGWRPAFFAEIEKFPSAVLAHHYGSNMPGEALSQNGVPNHGDFTKIQADSAGHVDLLVGGTPCQSFSIAGKRLGLDDARGNLALEYLKLAVRLRARWIVWENVPGVLSSRSDDGSSDFASFLSFVRECGYGFAYRVLDAQFVRVDRFPLAIPQRRRRVFLVGYLGDWRRAAAILFDRKSLRGEPAPRRQSGQSVAGAVAPSLVSSGRGVERIGDTRGQDPIIAVRKNLVLADQVAIGEYGDGSTASRASTASTVKARDAKGATDLLAMRSVLAFPAELSGTQHASTQDVSAALSVTHSMAVAYAIQAGAMRENAASGPDGMGVSEGVAYTHEARAEVQAVAYDWAVRRLMPVECERLMGVPDGYTNVPWRGKQTAPDGPRYKALGNSMAVNCMAWIGQRIDTLERGLAA